MKFFQKTSSCLIVLFSLIACSKANDDLISVGFNKYYGLLEATSQVGLAFTCKKKQILKSTFNVYIGARKGFKDDWDNDLRKCNPGYGTFAINRVIKKANNTIIKSDYILLRDFPDDYKYPLTYETIEGTIDGVMMHYRGFVIDEVDFGQLKIEQGKIGYFIVYYDDIKNKEFENNVYLYGIDTGYEITFNVDNNFVFFTSIY